MPRLSRCVANHGRLTLSIACLVLLGVSPLCGQDPTAQASKQLFLAGKKAYQERNYPAAAARYREYLGKYKGGADETAARFELALCLLEGPDRNPIEARELLKEATSDRTSPYFGMANYNLALAYRTLGLSELAQADAKPAEIDSRRAQAAKDFAKADQHLIVAAAELDKNDIEQAARIRCDRAELMLRQGQVKDAQTLTAGFVKDAALSATKVRDLGRYYFGLCCFLQKDFVEAQKTLLLLTPFDDPLFGSHARYLLARTHHLADELAEAMLHYEGSLGDFMKHRSTAGNRLKQPAEYKNDPFEKLRLESLLRETPEHLARALYYHGELLYEAGRFGEALTRWQEVLKSFPNHPLRNQTELRAGMCQTQMRSLGEASKLLAPLADKDPKLADRALYWLGKAQIQSADPANAANASKAIEGGIATLRRALETLGKMPVDGEVGLRRGAILLELGDAHFALKQAKESAQLYQQILNEKLLPEREEELIARLAGAIQSTGDFAKSNEMCAAFLTKFPNSLLKSQVAFTKAQNVYQQMAKAEADKIAAEQLQPLRQSAVNELAAFVQQHEESPRRNEVLFQLAGIAHKANNLDATLKYLGMIPAADRNGDLAMAPYLMADCILRQLPAGVPEDALAAGKLDEQLKQAAELLEAFATGPIGPLTAESMLRFGLVKQRQASLLADPKDRNAILMSAREFYRKLYGMPEFKGHPAQAVAMLENAKCAAVQGDVGYAIGKLQLFTGDPWKSSLIAPMAFIHLGTLLRQQNQPPQAAVALAQARALYEQALSNDPTRRDWAPLLKYHHAVALRESGKITEAKPLFDEVARAIPTKPEGIEAALRHALCVRDDAFALLENAKKLDGSKDPAQAVKLQEMTASGVKQLEDASEQLRVQAQKIGDQAGAEETLARMLYESAWIQRALAGRQATQAKLALAQELRKQLGEAGQKFPLPDLETLKVPVQPAQTKAMNLYRLLLEKTDGPLAIDGRIELAELNLTQGEWDIALALLGEAIDREPAPDATEKARLLLGTAHAAKGNAKQALSQFAAITQNPKSPLMPQALYRMAEVLLSDKRPAEAQKVLTAFRDQGPLQNLPGISDRALFRLGQLLMDAKDIGGSRQAFERSLQIQGNGPTADEARFGLASALLQQQQHEPAINQFREVVNRTPGLLAARAQFNLGQIRLLQKNLPEAAREFLLAANNYDAPEINAQALYLAGQALDQAKQNEQANVQWRRLIQEFPQSTWAAMAKERVK